MTLHIINENNEDNKNYVRDNMYEYNLKHFPDDLKGKYQEIHLFVKDDAGRVCGGILGEICWNWLEIEYLFVEPDFRRQGIGKRLMHEAEKMAREKNCDFIKIDTLGFQALDFYVKEGFEVYGTIENAGGYPHYYLKKDLK